MRHWKRAALAVLALGTWLASPGPAAAVSFNVPGCGPGVFTVIAQTKIGFENGPVDLTGNILVTKDDGLVAVGAHNKIHGTLIADKIFLGTGAVVDTCIADSITGPGTCTTVSGTFSAAPAECKVFDFVPPPIDPCVNAALLVNVPAGQTESLPPGCYGFVRIGLGATLNLDAGIYFIRELRLLGGATLEGATPGPRSRLLIKGGVTAGPGAAFSHLDVLTASVGGNAESLVFGNGVTFSDVEAIAAGSTVHVHTSSVSDSSAFAGVRVVIEPATFRSVEEPVQCTCPLGFKFEVTNCIQGISCGLARSCVPE